MSEKKKRTYEDFKNSIKFNTVLMNKKDKWPKYLGSLITQFKFSRTFFRPSQGNKVQEVNPKVSKGEVFELNSHQILHQQKYSKVSTVDYVTESFYVYLKGGSELNNFGYIYHKFSEIWAFLLSKNYVELQITIMNDYNSGNCQVGDCRIDVYLTDFIFNDPLSQQLSQLNDLDQRITIKKKKGKTVSELNEEDIRKMYQERAELQITRNSQVSLSILFDFLNIQVQIPTLVKPKDKYAAFKKVLQAIDTRVNRYYSSYSRGGEEIPLVVVMDQESLNYYPEKDRKKIKIWSDEIAQIEEEIQKRVEEKKRLKELKEKETPKDFRKSIDSFLDSSQDEKDPVREEVIRVHLYYLMNDFRFQAQTEHLLQLYFDNSYHDQKMNFVQNLYENHCYTDQVYLDLYKLQPFPLYQSDEKKSNELKEEYKSEPQLKISNFITPNEPKQKEEEEKKDSRESIITIKSNESMEILETRKSNTITIIDYKEDKKNDRMELLFSDSTDEEFNELENNQILRIYPDNLFDDDSSSSSSDSDDEGHFGLRMKPSLSINPFSSWLQNSKKKMQENEGNEVQDGQVNEEVKKKNDLLAMSKDEGNNYKLTETPKTMKTQLKEYQKQALTWMLFREGQIEYSDLYLKQKKEQRDLNGLYQQIVFMDKESMFFNPFNGSVSRTQIEAQETRGGILADEMGLGKTLMGLGLIHHCLQLEGQQKGGIDSTIMQYLNVGKKKDGKKQEEEKGQEDEKEEEKEKTKKSLGASQNQLKPGGTLLVLPKTVMPQWVTEINKHSDDDTITYHEYYTKKSRSTEIKLGDFDITITTFNTIATEYKSRFIEKNEKEGNLFNYHWRRIILDEGHNIKNRASQMSKAACQLHADARWVFTGTPVQNKLDDLYSILKFLRVDTFSDYFWWNSYVNKNQNQNESFDLIAQILHEHYLRRTKKSCYGSGSAIIELPKKNEEIIRIKLNAKERRLYEQMRNQSKQLLTQIQRSNRVEKQFMHIFLILTRLRQICDNPQIVFQDYDQMLNGDLPQLKRRIKNFFDKNQDQEYLLEIQKKEEEKVNPMLRMFALVNPAPLFNNVSDTFQQQIIENIQKGEYQSCIVCLTDIDIHVITGCGHVFCKTCFDELINKKLNCPNCRSTLLKSSSLQFIMKSKKEQQEEQRRRKNNGDLLSGLYLGPKVPVIMQNIRQIVARKEKVVIFTQWIPMMNYIMEQLRNFDIGHVKIDGQMSMNDRKNAISEFNDNKKITVFMASLKAGAVGLNLVAANHVFLVDPWWNPAIEDQATERVYRMGQTRETFVQRFIIEDSVEEKILLLHEKKRNLLNQAFTWNQNEKKKANIEDLRFALS